MTTEVRLGLKENWKQFSILVLINAFVGGMVGIERSIFPEYANTQFGITSNTAILSFIAAFGLSKAIANYFTGRLALKLGTKNLLIIGWLFALPIPFILIYATSWNWVVFANILLGINQGLAWSSTVLMKIDIVGEKKRGFAMGLNEFSGYLALGIIAFISGYVAHRYGITPYPFYIGILITIAGLSLTLFSVKDTRQYVQLEESNTFTKERSLKNIFLETTYINRSLSAITQAGFVNNLNDGMIWGLFPILLISFNYSTVEVGSIVSIYPMVWGIAQLLTGKMSDNYSKKQMLFIGMLLQGLIIIALPWSSNLLMLISASVLLGLGTALVYPTFFSAISSLTNPSQRSESIGTFRLWRDLGYVFGAIFSGIIADFFSIEIAILSIGCITILSSFVIKFRMQE